MEEYWVKLMSGGIGLGLGRNVVQCRVKGRI